jgi:hypothetical protein
MLAVAAHQLSVVARAPTTCEIGTFPRSARFKRGRLPRDCESIPTIARSISMTAAAITKSDVHATSLSAGHHEQHRPFAELI